MTSSTEDNLNCDLINGKALGILITPSIRTLYRGNKKYGREEVLEIGERHFMQRNL